MKPYSLSVLCLLSALGAQAEVVMVSGTVYDVGKGAYSQDSNAPGGDSLLCWAATASNLLQHWQDEYLPAGDTTVPNGYAKTTYTQPSGTRYLNIYNEFCNNFYNNGGTLGNAMTWYTYGYGSNLKTTGTGKYLLNYGVQAKEFVWSDKSYSNAFHSMDKFKSILETAFKYDGYGVFLGFNVDNNGNGHAITCWGYETDDSTGKVTALYITDSDDGQFGARRVDFTEGADGSLILSSDYGHYSDGFNYTINQISYLTSSKGTNARSVNTSLPPDKTVTGACNISGQTITTYRGLTVDEGGILVAAGADKTTLTLGDVEGATTGAGLSVKAGGMLSLDNAEVTIFHYEGDGMSVGAEARINGGAVSITGNGGRGVAVQRTAADAAAFLQLSGHSAVEISRNGGHGVYVEGQALMERDTALTIADNAGIGVYVKGTAAVGGAMGSSSLQISGSGVVEISGNTQGGILVESANSTPVNLQATVYLGEVAFNNNASVLISGNKGDYGGASTQGALTFSGNTQVTFHGNSSATDGGAVASRWSGHLKGEVAFTSTEGLSFTGNETTGRGGALFATGSISLSGNTEVVFSGNSAVKGGGAVASWDTGAISLSGNTGIAFRNNSTDGNGGAIFANGTLELSRNTGTVEISGNRAANGAALYVASEIDRPSTAYVIYKSSAHVDGNASLVISGNVATAGDIVYGKSDVFTIDNNGEVVFSGNDAGSGYIVHNADSSLKYGNKSFPGYVSPVIEIAHNGSVTFSGNTAEYDVFNEGKVYICADEDQYVTFQYGVENSAAGTTYIGKDAAGNTGTGGTYAFKNGDAAVEMKTSGATVNAGGGMVMSEEDGLTVSNAEMADASFALNNSSVTFSGVTILGDFTVDFGSYAEGNTLTMNNVVLGEVKAFSILIDLDAQSPAMVYGVGREGVPAETILALDEYLQLDDATKAALASAESLDLNLTVTGKLADGSALVIDTAGLIQDTAVTVTGYDYDRKDDGKLYYSAKQTSGGGKVPEPATATLSLLALAALCARRRRRGV